MNQQTIKQISTKQLTPDANQPRTHFDEQALQDLANDIGVRGIIEPVIYFTNDDGKKTILAGERRWRAAQLAGLKKIPCLLRDAPDPMARLFDQVSENYQRENLTPIELASFLESLVVDHKIKPKDLSDTIAKHGLKKLDRSYISNLRRLLKLPTWAQDLIQSGALTASHGKYLLEGMRSEIVMEDCRVFLEKHTADSPAKTSEIKKRIEQAFEDNHIRVNGYYCPAINTWESQPIRFDADKECEGCKKSKCIGNSQSYDMERYCLDEDCFYKLQKTAVEAYEKEQQKQQAKRATTTDTAETDDEHKSQAAMQRANGRIERTQAYLDEWLRQALITHLQDDEHARYLLVLWCAAGTPGDYAGYRGLDVYSDEFDNKQDDLFDHGIKLTLNDLMKPAELEMHICKKALYCINRNNLRALARHCEITLDSYQIDMEYLDIKNKDEIIATTPQHIINSFDDGEWQSMQNKPAGHIKDRIITRDYLYGTPADLQAMYMAEDAD